MISKKESSEFCAPVCPGQGLILGGKKGLLGSFLWFRPLKPALSVYLLFESMGSAPDWGPLKPDYRQGDHLLTISFSSYVSAMLYLRLGH